MCLWDFKRLALNRQVGDLFVFLLASDSRRARWSESAPMLCVVREREEKIVGDVKM